MQSYDLVREYRTVMHKNFEADWEKVKYQLPTRPHIRVCMKCGLVQDTIRSSVLKMVEIETWKFKNDKVKEERHKTAVRKWEEFSEGQGRE